MRPKTLLFVAVAALLGAAASGAAPLVPSAHASGGEVRTVTIALSPVDAAIAVDGHPRQHPNGALELRGPLGSVFTVEAVANGASVVQRVAITDVGALPARLVVTPVVAPVVTPQERVPVANEVDDCTQRTWRDDDGVKHYKRHCLFDDAPPPPRQPTGMGSITVVCMPKCDHVFDNGTDLGPGNIFNRPASAGMHVIAMSAANGSKKTIVVNVIAEQSREIRMSMDPARPAYAEAFPPSPILPTTVADVPADSGFLTVASFPWTKVSENGRTLCLTPCAKVALTPGIHVLSFENEPASVSQSVSVTIRSGEITVKRFAFK